MWKYQFALAMSYLFPYIFFRADYSLVIESNFLTELGGFVNFEGILSQNIYVAAPIMCYPDAATFVYWARSGIAQIDVLGTDCGKLI